ncbi:MAG: hypothetical protein R2824_10015 [Saprospiraceae bacterium]|nr:hypothetical protein [Lewinella sp.]
MDTPWQRLVVEQPAKLHDAIDYVHHAALIPAAVGNSLLPKADDDSQSNFEWLPGVNALAGQFINGRFRTAVRYLPFELLVLDSENRIQEGQSISGKTKKQLMDWMRKAITRVGGNGAGLQPISHFNIPDHPVAKGKAFPEIDSLVHHELVHYRNNAHWILNEVAGLYDDASPVRTWPHHFDTGAILTMQRNANGEAVKTIGIGWAIPDEKFDEPYFYVNHWMKEGQPDYDNLPELEGAGNWSTGDWKGAYLLTDRVVAQRQAPDQQQEVLQFFRSAIRATKQLI